MNQAEGATDLIFNLLDSLPVDNRCVFAITLWCIWKRKNDKIWKERNPSPSVSFSQAMQFLFEWSKKLEVLMTMKLNQFAQMAATHALGRNRITTLSN